MKKLATLCTIIALCTGQALPADNSDGKKVPPGLQKKGGVPPGQAKKNGQAEETTPAATAPAPAAASTPAAMAVPATAVATPATAAAKPATLAEQKASLEKNTRAINQAVASNPAMHKAALQHITKETGVTLEHLKEQDKNFPDASDTGLLLGNVVAKKAGVKFSDVLQARRNGKHWAEIAKAHNVDFGLLVEKSSQLAQNLGAVGAR